MLVVLIRLAVLASFALAVSACMGRSPTDAGPVLEDDDEDAGFSCDDGKCPSPASIAISPTVQNFGTIPLSEVSATLFFTVANDASSRLETGPLTTSSTGDFVIADDGCTASLAAGETCTLGVVFSPTAEGARSGNVTVSATSFEGSASAALSGTGNSGGPGLVIDPTTADFGDVSVGDTSASRTFALRNDRSADTGALVVTLGGADGRQFVIVTDACSGATLVRDATCEVAVAFAPSSDGNMAATLFVDGATAAPAAAAISGTALSDGGAWFAVAPTSRNFGLVTVGSSGAPLPFTVTNLGDVASTLLSASVEGADAADFVIAASTCDGVALAPAESCVVDIVFAPTGTTGPRSAMLTVGSATFSVMASLTGEAGVNEPPSLDPAAHDFGLVLVTETSESFTFTLTNNGGSTLPPQTVTISGTDAAMFPVVTNGCADLSIVAGASCTIDVQFAPTSLGDRSATLSVSDPSSGDIAIAALSGTATSN